MPEKQMFNIGVAAAGFDHLSIEPIGITDALSQRRAGHLLDRCLGDRKTSRETSNTAKAGMPSL